MADLITSAEFKTYAQIDHTDDDTLIAALITDVTADIEALTKLDFAQSVMVDHLNGGSDRLIVKKPPILLVDSIIDTIGLSNAVDNGGFSGDLDDWTVGSGWSYSGNRALHAAAGGTAALSQTLGLTVEAGQTWLVQFRISGQTAGSVTAGVGGNSGTARSSNAMFDETIVVTTASTQVFALTPTTAFDGSVDRVIVSLVDNFLRDPEGYAFNPDSGLIHLIPWAGDDYWFQRASALPSIIWAPGCRRWRVQYTGGYSAVPAIVKMLCKQMVAVLYDQGNPAILQEVQGDSEKKYGPRLAAEIRRKLDRFAEVSF